MLELIVVHIPKTAGISFEHTLRSVYGEENVLRLLIPIYSETKPRLPNMPNLPKEIPPETKAVIGHFRYPHLANIYNLDSNIPKIAWLRDPVERLLSHYYFLEKTLKDIVREEERGVYILDQMQRKLIEYARGPKISTTYSRFLEDQQISDFDFVGIQEYYNEDLKDLAYMLGWSNYEIFHHNAGPSRVDKIPEKVIPEIKELLTSDYEYYNEALELRKIRRKKIKHSAGRQNFNPKVTLSNPKGNASNSSRLKNAAKRIIANPRNRIKK